MRRQSEQKLMGSRDCAVVHAVCKALRHRGLMRDTRGNVAMLFALCAFIVVVLVGGAVDFGRTIAFKGRLQNALDAASLAAGSAYALDPDHDMVLALAQAQRYFDTLIGTEYNALLSKSLDPQSQTVSLTASAQVPTPFLALAGITQVALSASSVATTTETISSGSGESNVELAMMLDITGSMSWDAGDGGTKIEALRAAASALVEILLPTSHADHVRISLVPFAARVNIGEMAAAVTGQPDEMDREYSYKCNPVQSCTPGSCTKSNKKGQCTQWSNPVCTTTYDTCKQTQRVYLRRCMTERTGDKRFADDAPSTGFGAVYDTSQDAARQCAPNQVLRGLSNDRSHILSQIRSLEANGSTAGHIGTAWAWYTLSPNWAGVFPDSLPAVAYKTPNTKKIALLMTDGEYNTFYASGQGDSVAQAKALCDAMKAQGIIIYTVGFKLDSDVAIATLQYCATDPSSYFQAENAEQLMNAFREVAYRSVPLHLSR